MKSIRHRTPSGRSIDIDGEDSMPDIISISEMMYDRIKFVENLPKNIPISEFNSMCPNIKEVDLEKMGQ